MWKHKNTFAVTRYIRTIIVVIPMSLALIYYGVMSFPFALEKYTGRIQKIYSKEGSLYIELNNSSKTFETGEKKKQEIILSNLNQNQEVSLFIMKPGDNTIFKIEKNEKVLLDYEINIFAFIILTVGIGLLALAIYYLFKSPEDLWGGDKDRMNKDMDPWSKYKR
ncbi:MAG: hypothetical protein ACQETL_19990 [Bacteroidota bacterium]